jgi:beta-glucosidase
VRVCVWGGGVTVFYLLTCQESHLCSRPHITTRARATPLSGTCGEHFDRDDLDPPGAQLDLLRAVLNASKGRVIVVIIGGRPSTFGASRGDGYNSMFAASSAVLAAWRPGEEAGNAIWSIVNGSVNPSGRSAHTWPATVGQVHQYVPWFLPRGTRGRQDAYADMATAEPLVPFGFGLSYSNYTLSNAMLSSATVSASETFTVNVTVTGEGPAGLCVVQVYFSQLLSSRVRFDRMLLGFAKVAVPANGKATASVSLRAQDLEMWDKTKGDYVVEPGMFDLYVGLHSADDHAQRLSLNVTA